jgi:hypothetical protein
MNTDMFGLYCRSFLSSWFVCDIWPVVGVISMMNVTCGTGPYLPSWSLVSNLSFNGVIVAQALVSLMWTIVCLLFFLFLTILLRYVGSGYTNGVFRLSVCLLGLQMSLYLVRILNFVIIWIPIRLHQSNQAHSKT